MTFEEALPVLIAGGKIYRTGWSETCYAYIKDGRIWQCYDHGSYKRSYPENFVASDFVSDDWQIVGEGD